jgi:hypothetical protein
MKAADTGSPNFRGFLRRHQLTIFIMLLLAFAVRIGFVVVHPGEGGDPKYRPTAINILEGHGFSTDEVPPYKPGEASAPAYPLFVAGVYALFGRGLLPLALSQALLDLFTCLLVAFVSFSLAPTRFKDTAALSALSIYGVFSWPTMVWLPFLLAETQTFFFVMVTVAFCAVALRKGARYWSGAGVACGLAILTRPDSVLMASAIVLFLVGRWARRPARAGALELAGFCLALTFSLSPWIVRNYVSLGKFQPLASEYATARDDHFPTGYLWWLRTWLKDETHFVVAFNPAWFPESTIVDPGKIPREAYDSEAERQRLIEMFGRYNQSHEITPELDQEFRSLGNERIRRAPLRFFFLLPAYRTASLWLTGFTTSHPTPYVLILRILSVLPIHVGGILGLLIWFRRQPLATLLLLILLARTLFLAYHYAPETRYMAEVYPVMIAACGVTVAALWDQVSRRRLRHLVPSS